MFKQYCQAQPQPQFNWAELALVSINPAARLPSARTSREIAGIQHNLLSNICRSTSLHLKTILKMWKTTSMEDDPIEDNLNGRRPL